MTSASQVLAVAAAEIGAKSGAKYWGLVFPKTPYINGSSTPYCACFVSWVMDKVGMKVAGLPGGYCPSIWNAAKKAKTTNAVANAKPGDIVLFDWGGDGVADHIGFVEKNDNAKRYIQTIEGNTNGGKVARRTRAYSTVLGIIRPAYVNYPMRGIDVYSGEGWPLKKSAASAYKGSDFLIAKATQGTTYTNPKFSAQMAGAEKDGKLLGCYHYAAGGDPVKEAEWFYAKARAWVGKAVPCLDWEKAQNKSWGDKLWCSKFAKRTKELWGVYPLIYIQASAVSQVAACYPNCSLWIAGYPKDDDSWNVPTFGYSTKPWTKFAVWQFTSGGEKVDRNVCNLTAAEWKKMCKGTAKPAAKPAAKLAVDGVWGSKTTKALQKHFGTTQDGIVSGQRKANKQWMTSCSGWEWNDGSGSSVIRAMQKKLGVKADGWYGKDTSAAMRKHFGVSYTSDAKKRDTEIVKKLQKNLNGGKF